MPSKPDTSLDGVGRASMVSKSESRLDDFGSGSMFSPPGSNPTESEMFNSKNE